MNRPTALLCLVLAAVGCSEQKKPSASGGMGGEGSAGSATGGVADNPMVDADNPMNDPAAAGAETTGGDGQGGAPIVERVGILSAPPMRRRGGAGACEASPCMRAVATIPLCVYSERTPGPRGGVSTGAGAALRC